MRAKPKNETLYIFRIESDKKFCVEKGVHALEEAGVSIDEEFGRVSLGSDNSQSKMAKLLEGDITYINCRDVTSPYTWRDDMHPGKDGFKALANKFELTIS